MKPARILIIEDDPALTEILTYNFRRAGYETRVVADGLAGIAAAVKHPPDLVVLDLMLPGIDGVEICRRLRAHPATRNLLILMLTAKAEEADQMVGFAVGADDYVTKPFSVRLLLERVKALLRRRQQVGEQSDVLASQGVELDRKRHVVQAGGVRLELTPSEFGLLETLMRHPGRAFTRADLIDAALGGDAIVLERTIDVHIRSLRKKLGQHADLVETVRGVGYRFREP